jgi:nitrite reductase/ring-hydroxylating ferredoxin subunit
VSIGKVSAPTRGNGGEGVTRRTFCNHALLTSAGVALVVISSKGESLGQHNDLLFYPPAKVQGAEKLMPGSSMYFDYPKANDLAILVRTTEGEYSAYSRKCPHLGCSIEFDNSRRCLTCPCHRGAYDARTGHVMFGPPPRPLDQIILQVRGGGEVWAVGRRIGNADNNA